MSIDHNTLVAFAKSFGLLYLIAMSIAVVIYACRPANRRSFDNAARSILDDVDKPRSDQSDRTDNRCR